MTIAKGKSPVQFKVVEVERPSPALDWSIEEQRAIVSLAGHPGLDALMRKLKLQRSLLESQLRSKRHSDIRQVDNLQSGIFWTNWLERQVREQVSKKETQPPRDALDLEKSEFERVATALELVGKR